MTMTYAEMLTELDEGECAVINDKGEAFVYRKLVGRIEHVEDESALLELIHQEFDRIEFWGNVFIVNDHGNVTLVDKDGNEIQSWV